MKNDSLRSERGSLLIVAMLLAAIIAISLTSYLKLGLTSLQLANRTFQNNAAMNVAETGAEEALWSYNQFTSSTGTASDLAAAWNGWTRTTTSGSGATEDGSATRTFTGFALAANTTASVKVYIDHYNPSGGLQPTVVSQATVTLPDGSVSLAKTIAVKLQRRSYFATGLVARTSIHLQGNTTSVDSWNSAYADDGTLRAAPVPYSSSHTIAHDRGSVGAVNTTATVDVQNADVWGTAAVGGTNPSSVQVGSQGRVGPWGSSSGARSGVLTDFVANLENPPTPTGGTTITSYDPTLGTAGTTTTYRCTAPISGNLTINGNVTLIIDVGSGATAMNFTGHQALTISPGSTLTIYTAGNIHAEGGSGINNGNTQPIALQIYGTSTSAIAQTIDIGGGVSFKGVIYAPNASVTIHGNGDVQGSIVGNDITVTGTPAFHYDESLANPGASTPFRVAQWRELLTASERSAYQSRLAF